MSQQAETTLPPNAAPAGQPPLQPEQPKAKSPIRKFLPFLILGVVVVGVLVWWLATRGYEATDDAEVDGHMNPISARIAGTIRAVYIENNQRVTAGQPLVDLDPRDNQVAVAQAEAAYDQAQAQSTAERPNLGITIVGNVTDQATGEASVAEAQAALAAAQQDYDNTAAKLQSGEANNAKAQADLKRYTTLMQKQEIAESDFDAYSAAAKSQAAEVAADRAAVAAASGTIDQRRAELLEQQSKLHQVEKNAPGEVSIRRATIASSQANAEAADAKLNQARLNLAYTHIISPVAGIVSERSAEIGARVSEGQQLMMIVQTGDLWVTADFKETQLRKMRPGQSVRIHVDALDEDFDGYVQSMPAATGDRTSVLPPENATGNYVKVVQRLPVRIFFKPNQRDLNRLRPGMSVEPKVRVG